MKMRQHSPWVIRLLALFLFCEVSTLRAAVHAEDKAQSDSLKRSGAQWTTNFSLQTDWHMAQDKDVAPRLTGITYLDGSLRSQHLDVGLRLEEKRHPLPGREEEKGWGLPYFYLRGRYAGVDVTLGDIYEQFGSGLLFRAYEDRFLGLDNAVRGVRLNYAYREVFRLKSLAGQQRHFFDRPMRLFTPERGYLAGVDGEMSMEYFLPVLQAQGGSLLLGGGYLYKHEDEDDLLRSRDGGLYALRQPVGTGAWSVRGDLTLPSLSVHAEYAHKDYDPNRTNGFIFRSGSVAMLTASYLWGKSSLFVGARRSENFDFRSDRLAEGNALRVNFLQPFTKQQTYTLAAFYPYATQPGGEWAFQGAFDTSIPDPIRGRRPRHTNIKLYGSIAMGLRRSWLVPEGVNNPLAPELMGSDGYTAPFWGMKDLLFREVGIEVARRVSSSYSFVASYIHQTYHQRLIEGHASNGDQIHSNIFIYDGHHRLSKKLTLRTELQYLHTLQDQGDWLYGGLECSILPHFILSASDLWNRSAPSQHYYMYAIAGSWTRHTLRLSYGRTRAGINCSGGICRFMPETHGLFASYLLTL